MIISAPRTNEPIDLKNQCRECTGRIVEEKGFKICVNCGLVVEQVFLSSDFRKRESQISFLESRTINENHFIGGLGDPSLAVHEKGFRSDLEAIKCLRIVCSKLNIAESVFKQAVGLFKFLRKKHDGETKRNKPVLIAVCLYAHTNAVTINDIIQAFKNENKRVTAKLVRRMIMDLNLSWAVLKKRPERTRDYLHTFIARVVRIYGEKISKRYNMPIEQYKVLLFKTAVFLLEHKTTKRPNTSIQVVTSIQVADRVIAKWRGCRKHVLTQRIMAELFQSGFATIRYLSAYVFSPAMKLAFEKIERGEL